MRDGADWYKRNPKLFLGGVQGMTARQIAVYTVVIELIYMHGGGIHNDPKWIAGWVSDMGAAAVRGCISDLIEMGKLEIDGEEITQKHAKNEVKTKENLRKNRAFSGRLGGVSSAKTKAKLKENNDIGQASAKTLLDVDKIREEKNTPIPPKGDSVFKILREVLSEAVANDFIAHRKAKRAKMTDRAAKLIVDQLKCHSNPDGVALHSISNGWTGVFPESYKPAPSLMAKSDKWAKL